jgi:hypothetical protein
MSVSVWIDRALKVLPIITLLLWFVLRIFIIHNYPWTRVAISSVFYVLSSYVLRMIRVASAAVE